MHINRTDTGTEAETECGSSPRRGAPIKDAKMSLRAERSNLPNLSGSGSCLPFVKTDLYLFLFFIFCGFFWTGLRLADGRIELPSYYMLFVLFILAPVAEEFFFRGTVQHWLKKNMQAEFFGVSAANVITSVLFSAVHVYGWGSSHGFLVFAPSLAMGILYDRTRRVSFAILLHSIYNLNAIVVRSL